MEKFYFQCYYAYRGLYSWLNWPSLLSNVVFRPILMMFLFATVGRFAWNEMAAQSFLSGMTAYSATTLLSGGIMQCLANDRNMGTLPFLFVSSGSRLSTYVSRAVFHYPNAILCYAVGLIAAIFLLGMQVAGANWLAVAAIFPVIAFSVSCFALFLGSFAIAIQNWTVPSAAAETILLLLTGVIIPRNSLPLGARLITDVLPISHGLDGLRLAYAGGSFAEIQYDLAAEAGVGLVYAVAGYVVFRMIETYARRSGSYSA